MTDREKLVELLHDGTKHCRMTECVKCEYFTTLAYCKDNIVADHLLANGVTFAKDTDVPSKVETNIYDIEEIHHNCTVQILRNSVTGEQSIGWWPEEEPPREV